MWFIRSGELSNSHRQNINNINHLAKAITKNAPTEVLKVLMESRNIDVDCLDDILVAILAGRIMKSGTLQIAIIEIIAQRILSVLLFLQLAVNLLAAIVCLIHTEAIFATSRGICGQMMFYGSVLHFSFFEK